MMLDAEQYQRCLLEYRSHWRILDTTLYQLCAENPDHTQRDQVHAKLWIISRTYATGIERKIATTGAQGSSLTQLADHFLEHGRLINEWIQELRDVNEPLTPAHLEKIVSVHGRFVELLSRKTRNQQSSRSFVSKYLHFHNSAVPIYDSIAAANAQRIVRWSKSLNVFEMPAGADECYGWYVMRFFKVYEAVAEAGLQRSVKYVDNYLLSLAGTGDPSAPAADMEVSSCQP